MPSIFEEDEEVFTRYTDSGLTYDEYKAQCSEKIDAERKLVTKICDFKGLNGELREAVCKLWLDQLGLLPCFYKWTEWPKHVFDANIIDAKSIVPVGCKLMETREQYDGYWLEKTGQTPDPSKWEAYWKKSKARIDRLRYEALYKLFELGYHEPIDQYACQHWCEIAGILPSWYDWNDFPPTVQQRFFYITETPESRHISPFAGRYFETIRSYRRRGSENPQDNFGTNDWFVYVQRAQAQIDLTRLDLLKYFDERGVAEDVARKIDEDFCKDWELIPQWYKWKDFDKAIVDAHTYGKIEGEYRPDRLLTPELWYLP